jgi:signal transduction histidine kinase
LDLAKMEGGEIKLSFSEFDINEVIRLSIIKLENSILKKNINVEAIFSEEVSMVRADRDSIERVIINILHNAVKFSDNGGKITLTTTKKKEKIYIQIEDNGIGIGQEELKQIWDRFYKSDKSRGKDRSGTGLGLAIVKGIVNEHGEEIWVESEPGEGAMFTFTLSLANEKEN